MLAVVVLTWLPLLLLSLAAGHAWGNSVTLPFLHDVELHVRLLVALPLMIVAELVVHQRMRPVVGQFRRPRADPGRGAARNSTRPSPRPSACETPWPRRCC